MSHRPPDPTRQGASLAWAEVVAAIGAIAAARLALQYRIRRVSVPKNPKKAAKLLAILGVEATESLCAAFGGLSLDLPVQIARHAEIHRRRAKGESVDRIAGEMLLTRACVQKWLRLPLCRSMPCSDAPPGAARQLDLFGGPLPPRE